MYWIQEQLKQPDENYYLIRYMAEWKYESLKKDGLCFTQVFSQEDDSDGRVLGISGLGRMMNNNESGVIEIDGVNVETSNYRQNCYISCWVMEDEPITERFDEYCFKSSTKNIGYALKVKYSDLINFVTSQCDFKNGNYFFGALRRYFVNWGKIKYEELTDEKLKKYISEKYTFEDMHTFYKNKNSFEHEKEFRLKLTIAGGVYRPINNNYRKQGAADCLQFMPKLEEKCRYTLYKYTRDTGILIRLKE